jgi:hypothetical protein
MSMRVQRAATCMPDCTGRGNREQDDHGADVATHALPVLHGGVARRVERRTASDRASVECADVCDAHRVRSRQ